MKTRCNNYFLLVSLILVFTSCSVSNTNDDIDIFDGFDFTAKVNGKDFRVNKKAVTTRITRHTGYYSIAMVAGDIATGNPKAIALAMVGPNFDQLSAGKTFDIISDNDTEGGGVGYSEDLGSDTDAIKTDIIETVFIKITAIDKDEKLISGEFNCVLIDEDKNQKYTITEGQFKDISYRLD